MADRYLIINADDFGLCVETNDAVEHLFNEGRITSTTVMAPCRASADAVERAVKNRKIKMGAHLTLNSDYALDRWHSISKTADVSSILDKEGMFHCSVEEFYRYAKENEVAEEIEAQYDFVKIRGYTPTHADSHCGTLYGLNGKPFIKEAFEFCSRHGLPFRFPKSKACITNMFGGHIPQDINETHSHAVYLAESMGIGLPDEILTNPFNIRDIPSYENLKIFYLNAIRSIRDGVTELFLHPSKENSLYTSITPNWQKRIWEYRFLLDDDFMNTVFEEDIRLVSWANAVKQENVPSVL